MLLCPHKDAAMNGVGLLLTFVIVAGVAIAVSGSVWAGIVVAALELGFWALTRYLKGGRPLFRA